MLNTIHNDVWKKTKRKWNNHITLTEDDSLIKTVGDSKPIGKRFPERYLKRWKENWEQVFNLHERRRKRR